MRFARQYSLAAALGLSTLKADAATVSNLWEQVPEPPASIGEALAAWEGDHLAMPRAKYLLDQMNAERLAITQIEQGGGQDSGAVDSELEQTLEIAYARYAQKNSDARAPDVLLAKRTRWLQSAMGGRLSKLLASMTPCEVPCSDPEIIARNAPQEARKRELLSQDLSQWRALFDDWKAKRTPIIRRGLQVIGSVEPKALGASARSVLAQYRTAMLRETELLLSITELAVKRSHAIDSGQVDAVTGPSRSPRAQ